MTSALPLLITPVCIDDKCYIDGGISCNYPLNYCIESGKNPDEILGFKNKYGENKTHINSESTILDFLLSFLFKAVFSVSTDNSQPSIQNECGPVDQHIYDRGRSISHGRLKDDFGCDGRSTEI
jgi:predicted acylesterase/phospholipase RssA